MEPTQDILRNCNFQGLEDMTLQMEKFISESTEMTKQMAKGFLDSPTAQFRKACFKTVNSNLLSILRTLTYFD